MESECDEELKSLQREVAHLLGRCLLRLQQYELLLKAIVANHEISGPVHALEALQDKKKAEAARKTLGTLVGDFIGSNIVNNNMDSSESTTTDPSDSSDSSDIIISIRCSTSLNLSNEDFARKETELKELVLLRNDLVHHFIEQHEIGSLQGCRSGYEALVTAYGRIDEHFEELRVWVKEMMLVRRSLTDFLQSEAGREVFFNGIMPDGAVHWPTAGIVYSLRNAAGELAVDGWAPVDEAGKLIAEREPEQRPAKYGCRSWRQVVHESGIFELRYFAMNGKRSAWYREKEHPITSS